MNEYLNQVVKWFEAHVRQVIQKSGNVEVLAEWEKRACQIEALHERRDELFPICLVGQAGVGKSTLVNTLIADNEIVVPSGGGTGPLTANALRVVHGDRPSFIVEYHARKELNDTRFIIEAELTRRRKGEVAKGVESADEVVLSDAIALDSDEDRKRRTDDAFGRARLLIAGSQTATRELDYLADALRWVLTQKLGTDRNFLEEDLARMLAIRGALDSAKRKTAHHFDSTTDADFRQRLRDHACGFLAPLIKEMTIHWPSDLLKDSIELVDLPGIGVLQDIYQSVTEDYLRNKAKAVMLVVDSRGIRREDAELLKASGFLNRFLHSSSELASDPVVLMVVVVKIDDVAVENWRNDKAVHGTALRSKAEHFADQVERCRSEVAAKLEAFLREVWEDDSEGKKEVIQSIVDNLQVHPVSAPQYRLHLSNDPDDDRPFLADKSATNISALRQAVSGVATQCLAEHRRRYQESERLFFAQLRAHLELLSAQREKERQSEAELEKFRFELSEVVGPRQREFDTRRGEFRSFLRKTIPATIEAKVKTASDTARKGINRDLNRLRDAHWKTLQAAVRKHGTFYGARHINLPHDFALKFEEPVAEVWSREILVEVRKETRQFADYQSGAVEEVLEWARTPGIRRSTRLLEALLEAVKQHKQQVNAVGKEAVAELRDEVRAGLIKEIEGPIRKKCQRFVAAQKDSGAGVKSRILDLFRELSEEVVNAALEPATQLLSGRFKEVEKEILAAFKDHSDPIREAAEALVERHGRRIERDDAHFTKLLEAAMNAMPVLEGRAA